MSCPKDCEQDRANFHVQIDNLFGRTVPLWITKMLIAGVLCLFGLYAGMYAWASQTYATKEEVREMKAMLPAIDANIKELLGRTPKR